MGIRVLQEACLDSGFLQKVQRNRRFIFSVEYIIKKRNILVCQTKTEDHSLLQKSLFHCESEISLATLAFLSSFLIKIIQKFNFYKCCGEISAQFAHWGYFQGNATWLDIVGLNSSKTLWQDLAE